jgi:hypothetical protein
MSNESRAVADNLFAAVEELKAAGRRLDRVANVLERLAPDIRDLHDTFEGVVVHEIRAHLGRINERLAVVESNVEATQHAAAEASAQAFATREATGRVQLTAASGGSEKSGATAKVAKIVFSAPVAKILAVSVLVIALAVGAAGAIVVLQEVRAIKARLGGEK